jgi:hypothetical protein
MFANNAECLFHCAILASGDAGFILQQDQALAAVSGKAYDLLTAG